MSTGRSSPRRSLSDSMDYDEELVELHEYSNREFPDSDEDTEDASEDGEARNEEVTEIKEQVYFDKLAQLKAQLQQLCDGTHPEFSRRIIKIDRIYKERLQLNEAWRDYEAECVEMEYRNEKKNAAREFEDKKIELKENLIHELEEKRKAIEHERFSVELASDATEVKTVSTRKLRRRPNEPVPIPEKRRKTPQSQITFLLDEKEIDNDLHLILQAAVVGVPSQPISSSQSMESSSLLSSTPTDVRIEDGKLFYEKRWFHRGQPVYVEGKELPRVSGVISAISQDTVWVRKLGDQAKFRVQLSQLVKGKCSIKRRA